MSPTDDSFAAFDFPLTLVSGNATPIPVAWSLWLMAAVEHVPVAEGTVTIFPGEGCPGAEEPACVAGPIDGSGPQELYFDHVAIAAEGRGAVRMTLLHELGHVYDRLSMPAWARQEWLRIMRQTRPWRSDGPNSPHEQFAESYRLIARGYSYAKARDREELGAYDFKPRPGQWRRLSRLFKRLAG